MITNHISRDCKETKTTNNVEVEDTISNICPFLVCVFVRPRVAPVINQYVFFYYVGRCWSGYNWPPCHKYST